MQQNNDANPRVIDAVHKKETKVMEKFGNYVYRETEVNYYKENKLYLISYKDRDVETTNYNELQRGKEK